MAKVSLIQSATKLLAESRAEKSDSIVVALISSGIHGTSKRTIRI